METKRPMKIFFTSDLHGEEALYRQIRDTVRDLGAEVLILGGDLLPSLQKARRYEEMIQEQRVFIGNFLLPFFRNTLPRAVKFHGNACGKVLLNSGSILENGSFSNCCFSFTSTINEWPRPILLQFNKLFLRLLGQEMAD